MTTGVGVGVGGGGGGGIRRMVGYDFYQPLSPKLFYLKDYQISTPNFCKFTPPHDKDTIPEK